jgi:Flp pilus assembly protein TadB
VPPPHTLLLTVGNPTLRTATAAVRQRVIQQQKHVRQRRSQHAGISLRDAEPHQRHLPASAPARIITTIIFLLLFFLILIVVIVAAAVVLVVATAPTRACAGPPRAYIIC